MKSFIKFTYLLIIVGFNCLAQNSISELEDKYSKIGILGSNGDFKKAEEGYVELIKICKREKYYNLASLSYANLGYIYQSQGKYDKARNQYKEGMAIGEKSNQKSGLASNYGSMGLLSQMLETDNQGVDFILKGISVLENSYDSSDDSYFIVLGHLYNLLSFSKIRTTDRVLSKDDSLKIRLMYSKKALEYYRQVPEKFQERKKSLYSTAYINIASIEHDMGNYDVAIKNLELAKKYNIKNISRTSARIYLGLVLSYESKKNDDSVIYYGTKFVNIENNNDKEALLEVYEHLANAYKNKGELNSANGYIEKYQRLDNSFNKNKLKTVVQMYKENTNEVKEKSKTINKLIYVLAALATLSFFIILYLKQKNNRDSRNFKKFRESLNIQDITKEDINTGIRQDKTILNTSNTTLVSSETEISILKGLDKFEKKLQFRKKGMTQGMLAAQLMTNSRYLTIIIKKYKADNFNNYINELRIKYILNKIETDRNYRKYKISFLAEDSGFSTPTLFTKAFKDIVGITPSKYRELLDEELGRSKE
ncbi:HTH-type transcriptional regulator ChbR [Elizabethkingia miricola]|nr:HTH-type transcriptional regulator ChbR [Elizabethkingia miricola]